MIAIVTGVVVCLLVLGLLWLIGCGGDGRDDPWYWGSGGGGAL